MGRSRTKAPEEGKKTVKIKVNFIATEGDIIKTICDAISPNISSILLQHGASLNISIEDIMRNHAKKG